MLRGPKEKKERALGVSLQLKGSRCLGPKCALVRKPYKPGAHGQSRRRRNLSDFGRQIQEKQKCKLSYGINERALRQVFQRAFKKSGSTTANILSGLESRLDNVVFRLGLAPSRSAARQLVLHGHIMVNAKKVYSPGYALKVGDTISIRPESSARGQFKDLKENLREKEVPSWLQLDVDKMEGRMVSAPEGMEPPFEVNLLVESFSK